MKPILFNFTDAELEQFITNLGQPKFRAKQIREWLNRGAPDFMSMKNIPETLRKDLDSVAQTLPVQIVKKLESADGETTKFLLELNDGEQIECVLMRTTYGNSVCVSSQAGCAMGCKFCASTLLGLKRNLTANEIYAQILVAQWELRRDKISDKPIRPNGDANNGDVSHIVIMGTVKGTVHAGAKGNREAIVAALNLLPTQLRIADVITRSPDEAETLHGMTPEIAYIKEDRIYIEEILQKRK